MIEHDLIRVALALAHEPKRGALRQVYIRRSISTSYYALFHALARFCANEIVGASKSKLTTWHHVHRALEHGSTKNALLDLSREVSHPNIKLLTEAFVNLQQWRHDADYDLSQKYTSGFAEPCTAIADMAISALHELPSELRSRLATALLIRTRRQSKP